jgi:hypothetical protein
LGFGEGGAPKRRWKRLRDFTGLDETRSFGPDEAACGFVEASGSGAPCGSDVSGALCALCGSVKGCVACGAGQKLSVICGSGQSLVFRGSGAVSSGSDTGGVVFGSGVGVATGAGEG